MKLVILTLIVCLTTKNYYFTL